VEVTSPAASSTVARLGELMEKAAAQKSSSQLLVERCARIYTPCVLLLAALVAAIGSATHPAHTTKWLYLALVVLVSACPCAMVISTPISVVCALTRAAKQVRAVLWG
jgi:Zn2+/Cd2+-exporting ATPase